MSQVGLIYDPAAVKKHVQETYDKLVALQSKVQSAANDNSLDATAADNLAKEYASFPVSYQIQWAAIDQKPEHVQAIADGIQSKLQEFGGRFGNNRAIPRLFNGNQQ